MLSPVKYQERLKNLSAIAAKVYAAVPASEPWSMSYINSELQRTGGITRDTRLLARLWASIHLIQSVRMGRPDEGLEQARREVGHYTADAPSAQDLH